ncbi:hypothetical protein BGZ57DRAFT_883544 [Hyaloscypha finlandica]|nr:hypothetical protein BGZ57DRAFT_883544 [Hyaloscypha finlandica]
MYHKLLKTTSTMLLFSLSIHVRGILVKTDHGNHTHYSSYLNLLQSYLLGCEFCLEVGPSRMAFTDENEARIDTTAVDAM